MSFAESVAKALQSMNEVTKAVNESTEKLMRERQAEKISMKDDNYLQNNKHVNISNIRINESCNQCGSCLGYCYDFLHTNNNGAIVVKQGTILKKDSQEFKDLQEICPMNAFEIDETINKNTLLNKLIGELKSHTGVFVPTIKDFPFNESEYSIQIPFASGENRYDYTSDSAANKAAAREFERLMFSRVDSIILEIVSEYRVKKVKPYYTDDIEQGSVYAKNNQYVSELLEGIRNLLGNRLPSDFSTVNIFPNDDFTAWKMLNKGEILSSDLLSIIKRHFDYTISSYDFRWDTDDQSTYEGRAWGGGDKYSYKYCYRNVRDAFEELAKDIKFCCHLADTDVEERAADVAGALVNNYNKKLKDLIAEKLKLVEKNE